MSDTQPTCDGSASARDGQCGSEDARPQGKSRRDFLKEAAAAVSGVLVVIVGADQAEASGAIPPGAKYDPTRHAYVYLIDITKCIGCGACVRACKRENNVPEHFFRTWVERYMVSRTGEESIDSPNGGHDGFPPLAGGADITKAFFVPKLCNHCTNTPCVQLCPVGASYRSPDGVILVDEQRCIGCGYCVQACPYGSRFIHPEKHVASKCTLCYHRITKGLRPACVEACPVGARQFGDARDPEDKVSAIIATEAVDVLKPELHTEPNCYYLGSGMEVR